MLILTIRTDKPEAEIGLYDQNEKLAYETWAAHRQLAETIHNKIEALLYGHHRTLNDIGGVVCFKGPGSFTGLRIGLTVGNTLAYGLGIPVVATENEDWINDGLELLQSGENENIVMPAYGSPVHITEPKT